MDTVIDIYDYEDDCENQKEIKNNSSYKMNKREINDFSLLIFIVVIMFIIECFLIPESERLDMHY